MRLLLHYLSGAVLVRLADEGARVALILLALERTRTPAFGGILVAAFLLPHVVAAPLVGAFADRTRHPRLVHAAGPLLSGAALAVVGFGAGRLPNAITLAVAAVGGIGAPLMSGGLSGALRSLVPAPARPRAYGLDVATYNTGAICGPALAGVLASTLGAAASVFIVGGLAAAGGAVIGLLPLEASTEMQRAYEPWRGVAHLWRSRRLRAVTIATGIAQVGIGGVPIVVVLLAQRYGNTSLVGYLLAAIGIGALLGSLAYARRPLLADRPELMVWLDLIVGAVPLALVPLVGAWPAAGLLAASGFLTGPGSGAQYAVRDQESPRELNTEIFALAAGLKISLSALGAGLAGALLVLGPTNLMLACAACQLLGAGLGLGLLYGSVDRAKQVIADERLFG